MKLVSWGICVYISKMKPKSQKTNKTKPFHTYITKRSLHIGEFYALTSTRILGSTAHTFDFPSWSRLDPSLTFSFGAKNDLTLLKKVND